MKRFIIFGLVCLTVAGFSCTGDDNYNHRTPTAVVQPTATPTPESTATPIPELDPPLPKVIGFNMTGDMADPLDQDPYNFQSNEETAKQVVENGFRAVHLFAHERLKSADMRAVVKNPDIRVIAFRPMARIGHDAGTCREGGTMTWENADMGQMAYELLKWCGDLSCRGGAPLTFIFNPWESDWQVKGIECPDGVPPYWREFRVLKQYEIWQLGVEWARSEFPDAEMQVLLGMVINHTDPNKYPIYRLVCDGLPKMEHKPDVIGLTHYSKLDKHTPEEAIDVILECSGYPASRIYIAETGWGRNWDTQENWFKRVLPAFEEKGINTMFLWMWKQYWPGDWMADGSRGNNWFSLWEVNPEGGQPTHFSFTGKWTEGLEWVAEWKMEFEDDPLPYVPPPTGFSPTPTFTPVPPTPTPTPTENPDSCSECPAPGSIGCTIAYGACVQCWENCGQPIEDTPTPTPVTPTPVPPTPTPEPGDCSHCPAPESIGCTISYRACEQCWADCGQPLATPTPVDTPTPTPTPIPPTVATIKANTIEGTPTHCTWVATHQDTGFQTSRDFPDCSKDIHATFNQVGWWSMEQTVHYGHGYTGVDDPCNGKENTICGDLDGDGLYEYRSFKMIEVIEEPEVPIVS